MDASGDAATVLETLFQCLESQSLYLRSYHSSSLPLEDTISLMDCFEERKARRYSMRGISLEEEDGEDQRRESFGDRDEEIGRYRPFRRRPSQRELSEGLEAERGGSRGHQAKSRESLGVYGAIMQVNWEEDH
jgi:hypothetical protein